MKNYFFAFLCVAVTVIGQLVMKVVGTRTNHITDLLTDWRLAGLLGTALFLYAASTLLWVDVLRELPLSRAYMILTLAVVLVPFTSALVFGETISKRLIIGMILVGAGIIISNYE
ncbi:MAG: EamA family transporter [Lentilitoribacter sp.]